MCLAVPGRILSITDTALAPIAQVDFDGQVKDVKLAYTPDAQVGDYVVVHLGYAMQTLDEAEALETIAQLRDLGTTAHQTKSTQ